MRPAAAVESPPPALASEHQVAEILDNFDEGFCAFDRDWRIVHCNRTAEIHVGMRREQALGKVYWDVIPGARGGKLEHLFRRAMETGQPFEVEIGSAVRQGAMLLVRGFPLQNGMGISFRDITERREQLRREREQAARLDLALAAAGLGDWSWDAASDEITFSPRAADLFGVPPGLLMTWSQLLDQLNGADRDAVQQAVVAAVQGQGDYEVEYRVTPPAGGDELWVQVRGKVQADADGLPTGMIGVVADITPAKLREAQVVESEVRFRTMADGAPAPIWVTTAAGPVEFVNQAFSDFAGLPREAMLGDGWVSLLHREDIPAMIAIRAQARKGPDAYTTEARFRRNDGEWRWMQAISQPRFDVNGVFQGYVGIATDLTDIRAAEARQQLMINELNHRVKNTLATVQSLTNQTARLAATKEEFKDKLLARLMALSAAHNRLTQSSWGWTEIAEVVGDQLNLHGGGNRIIASGPQLKAPAKAALSLSLALHELATNAVKYGALSCDDGLVLLRWDISQDDEAGRMVDIEWREKSGPTVSPPQGRGFGSRLLETVGRDLGGNAQLAFDEEGLTWTASFPLPDEREERPGLTD